MDRNQLVAALPRPAEWNKKQSYERKAIAEDFIGAILDAIEAENREPDDWESHDIAAAIGYVAAHWYNAALNIAERSLTPPEDRGALWQVQEQTTVHQFREALDFVRGMPARAY